MFSPALGIVDQQVEGITAQPAFQLLGDSLALGFISAAPGQQPLPLWVGGSAEQAVERTARWGTGWQAGIETPAEVAPVIAAIKKRVAEIGRNIDEDHYGEDRRGGADGGGGTRHRVRRHRRIVPLRLPTWSTGIDASLRRR